MASKQQENTSSGADEVYEMACIVDNATLMEISQRIPNDWRNLGRAMGLQDTDLDCLVSDYGSNGTTEVAYQTMNKWRKNAGHKATTKALARHLSKIKREDLADQISKKTSEDEVGDNGSQRPEKLCIPPEELLALFDRKKSRRLLLNRLKTSFTKRYKKLLLKGLPWMKDLNITLDDYYVELSMTQQDENGVDLPEKFTQINRIFKLLGDVARPTRVLIEGGPGFGKTTFACKLCHDYANRQHYLRHYDLAFLLPLRDFSGDLNELLIRASGVGKEDVDDLLSIINSKKSIKTLVILDGFDELPQKSAEKLLPFLRGEVYPNLTAVVTSRPGHFTSESTTRKQGGFTASCEIDISEKPFDRRIKINGFNESMQQEFTNKHLAKLNSRDKYNVEQNLKKLKSSQVLSSGFLQCPLFLLMVILLLTENETKCEQHFLTRTELYKEILNYVTRRYLFRMRAPVDHAVNLYSFEPTQVPLYVSLMAQFGQFAIEALKSDRLYFSSDEILTFNGDRDARIADLGLLTQTLSVNGFREKVCWEPVHKSLLEFSAAFSLWVNFVTAPFAEWEKKISSIRPMYATAPSSLVFYFLIGLMGKDVGSLFKALGPYAAEYSCFFGSLQFSMLDIQTLHSILPSLLPFLPAEWRINWYKTNLSQFSTSDVHKEVLYFGLKEKKIKSIYWFLKYSVILPDDVYVDKLALQIEHGLASLDNSHYKTIRCADLHCYFVTSSISSKNWENVLSLLSCIHCQHISFHFLFSSCSFFFPLIYEAVTVGPLKDIPIIKWMDCDLLENQSIIVEKLTHLVECKRVGGLRLELCPPSASGPKKGKDYQPLSQEQLDHLVACASKSSRLKHFALINGQQQSKPLIDLAKLSDNGNKSWLLIQLDNVNVQCSQQLLNKNFQLQHLCIANSELPSSVLTLMQSWCITLLSCSNPFLIQKTVAHVLHKHMTELHIAVNKSTFQKEFISKIKQLENLKILSLQMVPFDYQSLCLSVEQWLMGSKSVLFALKELQIRSVEDNPDFGSELVQTITKLLDATSHKSSRPGNRFSSSTKYQVNKLQLQTLTLQTNVSPNLTRLTPSDSAKTIHFFQLVSSLKQPLEKKALPRLDIVTPNENIVQILCQLTPGGFVSLSDMFSSKEGFTINHDKWGMRDDDAIWAKERWESNPPSSCRFSISHELVKKNV